MNIPRGRDSAITYGELAERLNVPRRTVEKAIQQMRLAGVPVITGNDGVWLAETALEAQQAAQALRRRAITQLVTARALRAAGKRMAAIRQQTLWEEAA